MGCRVGITTDLYARKAHWESVYAEVTDWQVLAGPFNTKAEAQAEESRLVVHYGCEAHPGGDDADFAGAPWYVYGFNHAGRR